MRFQGDIMFVPVKKIPADAKEQAAVAGKHVLAHSETGHDHTIDADGVVFYEGGDDPLTCYLALEEPKKVVHNRNWDTHDPISLKAGKWMGRRQREYTPEGWRRVED